MTLLFGPPAPADKVCLWDACLRDGFEASIDIREVAIPLFLKDACRYHTAITTGAVEVNMLVTREIYYPVVDVGEGAAVSLLDVPCCVFALLTDIDDDTLFEWEVSGKTLCRDALYVIDLFARSLPSLETSVKVPKDIVKSHTAEPCDDLFFTTRFRDENEGLFDIHDHGTYQRSEVSVNTNVDRTREKANVIKKHDFAPASA